MIAEPTFRHKFQRRRFLTGKEGDFIVLHIVLLFVLAAGAYYDIREHRIPNWWILFAMMIGITLCVLLSGQAIEFLLFVGEGSWFLFRMMAVIGVFFPLFFCRMIGAGDIKLAALMCGYLGMKNGAVSIALGLLIGAFWSFLKLAVKGGFKRRFSYFAAYIRRIYHTKEITAYFDPLRDGYDQVIPLGVCLFLGNCISMIL